MGVALGHPPPAELPGRRSLVPPMRRAHSRSLSLSPLPSPLSAPLSLALEAKGVALGHPPFRRTVARSGPLPPLSLSPSPSLSLSRSRSLSLSHTLAEGRHHCPPCPRVSQPGHPRVRLLILDMLRKGGAPNDRRPGGICRRWHVITTHEPAQGLFRYSTLWCSPSPPLMKVGSACADYVSVPAHRVAQDGGRAVDVACG